MRWINQRRRDSCERFWKRQNPTSGFLPPSKVPISISSSPTRRHQSLARKRWSERQRWTSRWWRLDRIGPGSVLWQNLPAGSVHTSDGRRHGADGGPHGLLRLVATLKANLGADWQRFRTGSGLFWYRREVPPFCLVNESSSEQNSLTQTWPQRPLIYLLTRCCWSVQTPTTVLLLQLWSWIKTKSLQTISKQVPTQKNWQFQDK